MVNRIARLLLESGAIEYGDFLLASGARSSYYIDIKAATTNPAILAEIGKAIAEGREFEVVAGVAVGGVPIAVAVSLASGRPYAIVRMVTVVDREAGAREALAEKGVSLQALVRVSDLLDG